MQFRLVSAIFASIIIIGIASWQRFGSPIEVKNIVAINQVTTTEEDYQNILGDFLKPEVATTTMSKKILSNTDILAHQLFIGYLGLEANGQASTQNLNNLANQYAGQVPTLHTYEKLGLLDVKTISNSKQNFQIYGNELAKIYTDHAKLMNTAGTNIGGPDISENTYQSFAKQITNVYKSTATRLQNLNIPLSFTTLHLQLINNQLSNSVAMKSISNIEKDPIMAFAGLIAVKENLDEEAHILEEISQILTSNGI